MGELIRCISEDGFVSVLAADTRDVVNRAQELHKTSAVVSAALGRLLTAAAFIGSGLKQESASVTLHVKGDGPLGTLLAVSDAACNVRGYAGNAATELPLNEKGKLDVGGAVGRSGSLSVMRDFGSGEPYIGQIPLVSGEIAEDITQYFAVSEQIPTVCALGVLVHPQLHIQAAGGFFIQLLPGAPEETISAVESGLQPLTPVTTLLDGGMTARTLCRHVLPQFSLRELECRPVTYRCDCSAERMQRALISLGEDELTDLAKQGEAELCCHFCGNHYRFSADALRGML